MATHLLDRTFRGAIETYSSVVINAPVEKVWATILDLPKHGEWNPFLRSQTMVDSKTRKPIDDQTLRQGGTLRLEMIVPPSLDKSAKANVTHETVSLVDHAEHRIIWGGQFPFLFRGEQAVALSATADGQTRYEARDTVGGVLGYPMSWMIGTDDFKKAGEAMAKALKERVESS